MTIYFSFSVVGRVEVIIRGAKIVFHKRNEGVWFHLMKRPALVFVDDNRDIAIASYRSETKSEMATGRKTQRSL